jgi:beta-N-acetylhexosaminidase
MVFSTTKRILYLRYSRIFQLYKMHGRQVNEVLIPPASLIYYLENSNAYLGRKRSWRYKIIINGEQQTEERRDPMTGYVKYVKKYGFDIDYAPVADVNTNPDNIVIGPRAFSDDPETAAKFVVSYLNGLESAGVIGTLKHFPGHGDVSTDTHYGYASTDKTWDEMLKCEMIPFKAGIKAGAQMIMTAHIAAPKVSGDDLPATLSPVILQDKLRGELGFDGVIVTDAMDMGAITKQFSNAEAAIKSIQAGVDVVLCSREFTQVFDAVVKAVEKGEIKESRIDESVKRILKLKQKN